MNPCIDVCKNVNALFLVCHGFAKNCFDLSDEPYDFVFAKLISDWGQYI